jgi:predicted small metal-binding protein
MAKSISCSDAGKDCPWSATAKTVDELMTQVIIHVKKEHKEIKLNAENISKIKSLIKENK